MPKELILGDRVTVRRGDLPVAAARTRADLRALPADGRDLQLLAGLTLANERVTELVAERDALRAHLARSPRADTGDAEPDLDPRTIVDLHNRLVRDHRVLRRRHEVLLNFLAEVSGLLDEAERDRASTVSRASVAVRLQRARDRLRPLDLGEAPATDESEAPPFDPDDVPDEPLITEDDPNLPADDPNAEVVLRVALSLHWVREGGQVTIGVIGLDGDGTEVDLGGTFATLDWAAANKLIKKTRVARDQSHGSPE